LRAVVAEWDTIQSLCYREQTDECAEFIRMMYTVRLKKVSLHDAVPGTRT
jgi:hypothetical protein